MGDMVRVSGVGRAVGVAALLGAGWVVGVSALPVAAWAKAGILVFPVLAPILTASTLKISHEGADTLDQVIEMVEAEDDED